MNINELFYSIQGEGKTIGLPTIFIRVKGCNLRCSYCDTTYAFEKGTEMTVEDILQQMKKYPCNQVCITGGEPLLQKDLSDLIKQLIKNHIQVCVETNGSCSIKELASFEDLLISLDVKLPSSNMHEKMNWENLAYLRKQDQTKFIISDETDYRYAKKIVKKYPVSCEIFFQPVWGSDIKKLASWILRDGLVVHLGVQLQRIIWGDIPGV